jgi:hypothetical protein
VVSPPAATYPRERSGTHFTGGWVGLRASLDRCGKSRLHRDSIPGPSSQWGVAIPTALPGPLLPALKILYLAQTISFVHKMFLLKKVTKFDSGFIRLWTYLRDWHITKYTYKPLYNTFVKYFHKLKNWSVWSGIYILFHFLQSMRHHSSIGIVTRPCGWTSVVRFPHGQNISSSRKLPHRLWVPLNLPYSGYRLIIANC